MNRTRLALAVVLASAAGFAPLTARAQSSDQELIRATIERIVATLAFESRSPITVG